MKHHVEFNATFGQLVMAKVPTDQIHGSFSSHIGMIVGCESATPTNLYVRVFDPATGMVSGQLVFLLLVIKRRLTIKYNLVIL